MKHKLTATKVKQALARHRAYKLADGNGLYLLIKTNGTKCWRYNYRFDQKEKTLALGVYPTVSLAAVREQHQEAQRQLSQGLDPSFEKRSQKLTNVMATGDSFEVIAREWFEVRIAHQSASHAKRTLRLLEKHLFPVIGKYPISRISAPELLYAIRRIESKGTLDMAHRSKSVAGQVFRFAIASGRAERDPSRDLEGALKQKTVKHHAAILDPHRLGQVLRDIECYEGDPSVAMALRISPYLFQRPGEVRSMRWDEVNRTKNLWEIPAEKMKKRRPHIVPLAKQVLTLLDIQQRLSGNREFVFPSPSKPRQPISDNAVRMAIRRLGYGNDELTPHGFRAIARTLLDEVLGYRVDLIEHQLAHAVVDATGRAYNRTTHLKARAEMMAQWANYLDGLREGTIN